jgi:hypothetical protein
MVKKTTNPGKPKKGYSISDKALIRGKASAIKAFEYGAPGRKDLRTSRQENILMNDANLAKNRANKTKVADNKIKNAANKNKVAINKIRTTAKKAGLSYR